MALILVVDDNAGVRGVVERALQSCGHQVLLAEDGDRAIRVWRERGADLVLLDIHMPNADGIESLVHLRALAPGLPIIMMSGGTQTGELDLLGDALLLGAVGVLAKPFTLQQLYATVAVGLGSRGEAGSA